MALFITAVYVAIVVGVGALRREPGEPRPVGGGRRDRGARVPAGPAPRAAVRRPPRLRAAGDALRGALRVLRAARERVRERRAAAADGPRAGRGHGRVARRTCGSMSGEELRAEAVWPQDAERPEPLVASENAEGSISPSSMLEPVRHQEELLGCAVDHEEAGGVDHPHRGEARARPGRPGGTGDAERRPHASN